MDIASDVRDNSYQGCSEHNSYEGRSGHIACVRDTRDSSRVFLNFCKALRKISDVQLDHGSPTRGPPGCITQPAVTLMNCVCTVK